MAQINRIGEKDTIRAYSYDKNDKLIATVYDSGFSSVKEVVRRLSEKGSGWLKKIYTVNIINEDRGGSYWYNIKGSKIVKQ